MRLITLGDSLTSRYGINQEGNWPYPLQQLLNCELINFGIVAGSNQLQIQLLQDWFLDNNLDSSDIIIWQIGVYYDNIVTADFDSYPKILRFEEKSKSKSNTSHIYIGNENKIDKRKHINFLTSSPYHKRKHQFLHPNTEAEVLQRMLFMFVMIKKLKGNLLVIKGGPWCIEQAHWNNMKEFLIDKNINFIDQSIVEWCNENNLTFLEDILKVQFNPKGHLTKEASIKYAHEVLYPNLKSLGWI